MPKDAPPAIAHRAAGEPDGEAGGPAEPVPHCVSLATDHALQVEVEPSVLPLVTRWLPRNLGDEGSSTAASATIRVTSHTEALGPPKGRPALALGAVRAWIAEERDVAELRGGVVASGGRIEFRDRRAALSADPASNSAGSDLYSMLTISAALLLADLGRALVHAAGVVSPDGGAWLIVGDAGVGKSTSCANLVGLGWGYLSDDQVVLQGGPAGVSVEGWLRPFHLDAGSPKGGGGKGRVEVSAATLGPGRWHQSAPLHGFLLPVLRPIEATELVPISPAQTFAGLVRQAPWLLARRRAAGEMVRLLRSMVLTHAGYRLRLGRDTHQGGPRLRTALRGLKTAQV